MKIGKGRVRYFSKGGPEVDRLKKRDERGSKKGDMRQRKVGRQWMACSDGYSEQNISCRVPGR